ILEDIIEETKPPIPPGCEGLPFLLMTPFRYSIANPWGSRFRKPKCQGGVFYASEHAQTAIAKPLFHRLIFFADSPATPWPQNASEATACSGEWPGERAIDLTGSNPAALPAILDPVDYAAGQAFAETARDAGIEIIKYPSVRAADHRANLAVLTPAAFVKPEP